MFKRISGYFTENEEVKKIIENIFWLFSGKLLRYGVGFFLSVWVANYLGVERFGNYNVAVAYMFIFSAIATLGLNGVVTRELVKRPEEEGEILGSTFVLIVFGSIIAFFSAVLTAFILSPDDQEGLLLVAIVSASLLLQGAQVFNYYYSAKVLSKYIVLATNVAYIIGACLKVYGVYTGQNLIYFAWIILCEAGVSALLLTSFFFFYKGLKISWKATKRTMIELVSESLPLVLSGVMVSIYMKVDQIMLKELSSDHEAGLYAVAIKLTEVWYFVPVVIQSSVFPNLTKSKESEGNEILNKFYRLFSLLSVFSVCVISLTFVFGNIVVDTLFSEEFNGVYQILAVSIFSLLFVGMGVVRNSFLLIKNLTVYTLYFTSSGAIINLIMNYYLIPLYGGLGAAISTVVSYAFSAFVSTFFVKELRPLGMLMIRSVFYPKIKE
jgi:O-antigen/teichoic acid export membrane protein